MIDIHTHILAGLDDGPRSWDETIELCRIARKDGVRAIVATPHIMDGVYPNTREVIKEKVLELRERIKGETELQVYWGADARIATDLIDRIKNGDVPTINDNGYLLLELPHDVVPPRTEKFIFDMRLHKITPIITHVERCNWARGGLERVEKFVEMGALIQVTAMSVTGGFGRGARKLTEELLRLGLVHVIASDAHSVERRPTGLSAAVKAAATIVGEQTAMRMVKETPRKIIEGEKVENRHSF